MARYKVVGCLFALGLVGVGLLSNAFFVEPAEASLAGFSPGNIMSDHVMSNKNTMSEAQIQGFLKSKNSCNDTDWGKYERYTAQGYRYNWRDGHFVCMADESFNGESATHIIWKIAQEYSINPQVLIVLLQKEQGLVTDTWPNSRQYEIATGYGCPDNAACDSARYGFENQLRFAAKLFREVLDGGWSNYPAYNTVYAQYNANKACGGTDIYIENRATSALYRYTPYQPNAYAMGGGSDSNYPSCGAFGNRNFYDYFTDWFGSATYSRQEKSNIYLPDGIYYIVPKSNEAMAMDAYGEGNTVHLWDKQEDYGAQSYKITRVSDGYYKLLSIGLNRYLDVKDTQGASEAQLITMEENAKCGQKWAILRGERGEYELLSACGGLAATVRKEDVRNGGGIRLESRSLSSAQRWELINVDEPVVADGYYSLTPKISSALALDAYGPNNSAHLWGTQDSAAQKFKILRGDDGFYELENFGNKKLLTVAGYGMKSEAILYMKYRDESCAQKWVLTKDEGGLGLASGCSGLAVDVKWGGSAYGTVVWVYERNGTKPQRWEIKEANVILPDGTYTLVSKMSGRALDVKWGENTNGTVIWTYEKNGTRAQQFEIKLGEDGYYTIRSVAASKFVDVSGGGSANGTNIQIWQENGTCAQKWSIEQIDDGYIIVNLCSGKSLDMSGINKNEAKVHLWDRRNSNINQVWKFVDYALY